MQTGYGKMAIEEYAPGKVRMVGSGESKTRAAGERSEVHRPDCKRKPKEAGNNAETATRTLQTGSSPVNDEYDSKLEAARAHYLGMLKLAGDVRAFIHHPFPIQLTPKRKYRPDFLVWWADGRITVEETKGSLKQKNCRDSITRLHVAAAMFPMFTWMLVMQVRGQWEERRVA